MYEQEKHYEMYLGKEGDIMIAISKKADEPVAPKIIYDGGDHALFYRIPEKQTILLDYVHKDVKSYFKKVSEVLIVEVLDDADKTVEREYKVPVRIVKSLPISKDGLITPEQIIEEMEKEDKGAKDKKI